MAPLAALESVPSRQVPVQKSAPVREGWNPALFDLIKQCRTHGLALSEKDRAWFSKHLHTHWYWSGESARPTAYAAINRGIDLPGILHEWGGEADALQGLLLSLGRRFPTTQILVQPEVLDAHRLGFKDQGAVLKEALCLASDLTEGQALLPVLEKKLWFWGLDGS